MGAARAGLNDHVYIYADGTRQARFMPEDALRLHGMTCAFLEREVREGDVVVTHHCPHPGSVARKFAGDPVTPAFCSDLSEVIEATRPALWIHGHTHTSFDYEAGATRIVCNPHGYFMENSVGFKPGLVVDLQEGFTCRP
jgi:Icc-related predicted phosphoesterase